jgi:hypothetical protein
LTGENWDRNDHELTDEENITLVTPDWKKEAHCSLDFLI